MISKHEVPFSEAVNQEQQELLLQLRDRLEKEMQAGLSYYSLGEALGLNPDFDFSQLPLLSQDSYVNSPVGISEDRCRLLVKNFEGAAKRADAMSINGYYTFPPSDRYPSGALLIHQAFEEMEVFYTVTTALGWEPEIHQHNLETPVSDYDKFWEYRVDDIVYKEKDDRYYQRINALNPKIESIDGKDVYPPEYKLLVPYDPKNRQEEMWYFQKDNTIGFTLPLTPEMVKYALEHEKGHKEDLEERKATVESGLVRGYSVGTLKRQGIAPREISRGVQAMAVEERNAWAVGIKKQKRRFGKTRDDGSARDAEKRLKTYETRVPLQYKPTVEHGASQEGRRLLRFQKELQTLLELKGIGSQFHDLKLPIGNREIVVSYEGDSLQFGFSLEDQYFLYELRSDGVSDLAVYDLSQGASEPVVFEATIPQDDSLGKVDSNSLAMIAIVEGLVKSQILGEKDRLVAENLTQSQERITAQLEAVEDLNWQSSEDRPDYEEAVLRLPGNEYSITREKGDHRQMGVYWNPPWLEGNLAFKRPEMHVGYNQGGDIQGEDGWSVIRQRDRDLWTARTDGQNPWLYYASQRRNGARVNPERVALELLRLERGLETSCKSAEYRQRIWDLVKDLIIEDKDQGVVEVIPREKLYIHFLGEEQLTVTKFLEKGKQETWNIGDETISYQGKHGTASREFDGSPHGYSSQYLYQKWDELIQELEQTRMERLS